MLDAFAGTGALGLEALSRGAAHATFLEQDRAALAALRANIAACRAAARCTWYWPKMRRSVRAAPHACGLIFLDPPYGRGLASLALQRLRAAGWVAPCALVVAEVGRDEEPGLPGTLLADRAHGAARITVWGATDRPPGL